MCISAAVAAVTSNLATTVAVASTAISTIGAVQQARAQRAQAEYNAAVARNNAIISAQNEADVIQRGEIAKDTLRSRVNQTIGAARASIAGTGFLVDAGAGTTQAALLDDLTTAGQFDIMTLQANIDREARKASIQGTQYEAQAGLFDLQASSISPGLAGLTAAARNLTTLYEMFPSASGSSPTLLK